MEQAMRHHRKRKCVVMVMSAQVALLFVQLASGLAWHMADRPSNSGQSMAGPAGCRPPSTAMAGHQGSWRHCQSHWLIHAREMTSHIAVGHGPGAPFRLNTKTPTSTRRLPHSTTEAAVLEEAVVADNPTTLRGSGPWSTQEERLRWLEACLSKLDARHAKVIADEGKLHQHFKELAEFKNKQFFSVA